MYKLLLLLMPLLLTAALFKTAVISVDSKKVITEKVPFNIGATGFIVHAIDGEHITITNKVTLIAHENNHSIFTEAPFIQIKQSYLPSFTYESERNDTLILGFGYDRAMLIAPNEKSYYTITEAIQGVTWVHPDLFATFLSRQGHPSPTDEDIKSFCQISEIGLLYIFVQGALNTLDCQSLHLLQLTAIAERESTMHTSMRPFYSRIEEIDEAWFGKGSSPMDDYERFYVEKLLENSPDSISLIQYISNHDTNLSDIIAPYLKKLESPKE